MDVDLLPPPPPAIPCHFVAFGCRQIRCTFDIDQDFFRNYTRSFIYTAAASGDQRRTGSFNPRSTAAPKELAMPMTS